MRDHQPVQPNHPTREPRSSRSIPLGIIAAFSITGVLVGGGAAWWAWQSVTSEPLSQTSSSPAALDSPSTAQSSPEAQVPAEQTVQIYWLKTVENRIEPTASPVTVEADQPNAILKSAFEQMLQGSSDPELTSTIPDGTQLRTLEVKDDGVHVDLSQEFTTGGGSTSMTGRLAQVVYTATTLNPDAPVWISVEGEPLEVLGGEGLLVDQPITREGFQQNFPL
ncbi:MAG: hypothetical protein Kow00121_50400 [Elainellaceae cyanobacterium]